MRGVIPLSFGVVLVLALVGPAPAASLGTVEPASVGQAQGGGLLLGNAPGSLRAAPVLASDVHVEIAGIVARTRLTQIFRNPTDRPLEAVYVFPLPAGAAVDGLSLAIGQRAVRGRVVERAEAEGSGRQALSEGRKAAVLTREGPDLFTVAVGSIAPGEEAAVVLDLQQVVVVEGGRFTLRFPMLARSAPGLPEEEAAALAAPRRKSANAANPPNAAPGLVNPFDLHVDLYPGIRLGRIESSSHAIRVAEKAGPLYTVDLERAAPADRDFVLSWEPIAGVEAQAALYTHERDGERYVLLMVLLPAGAPGLTDIAVRWDDPEAETWPRSLPNLKPGTALVVAARLTSAASLAVISGRRGKAPWEVVLPLSGAAPGQAIDKLWARLKVEGLGNSPKDVTEIGLRYGLVTEHTSLVAEDTVAADGAVAGGAPQRAWVPLAEPGVDEATARAGKTLTVADLPRAAVASRTPASVIGKARPVQTSIRARPDTTRAQLRRRLHHRRHRRHSRLLRRRRHHRARAAVKAVAVVPVGEALTPRARLGAQAQRR
jgi:hypothetical protein